MKNSKAFMLIIGFIAQSVHFTASKVPDKTMYDLLSSCAKEQLAVFKSLCGHVSYPNVVVIDDSDTRKYLISASPSDFTSNCSPGYRFSETSMPELEEIVDVELCNEDVMQNDVKRSKNMSREQFKCDAQLWSKQLSTKIANKQKLERLQIQGQIRKYKIHHGIK